MIFRNIKSVIFLVLIPMTLITITLQACEDITAPGQSLDSANPETPPENNDDDPEGGDDNSQPLSSYIGITDENFFVQQDNSLCGPASFYMIFKYYGDPYSGATLSTTGECVGDAILSGIDEIFNIILDTSWISDWLDSVTDGIDCRNFNKKISALSQCTAGIGLPFYATVDGNCGLTGDEPDDYNAEANVERRDRFEYIVENFLQNKFPVILHLRRMYDDYPYLWYPGHYVVLMGYDSETREVHIMDPFQEYGNHRVMTVAYDSFIMNRWYQSSGSLSYMYPDARWDGTWIGFHH